MRWVGRPEFPVKVGTSPLLECDIAKSTSEVFTRWDNNLRPRHLARTVFRILPPPRRLQVANGDTHTNLYVGGSKNRRSTLAVICETASSTSSEETQLIDPAEKTPPPLVVWWMIISAPPSSPLSPWAKR